MSRQALPGVFGDLAYRGDELVIARSLDKEVVTTDWSMNVAEFQYLMFINMAIEPITGRIFVTGKAHVGNSTVILSENFKTVIPGGHGNYSSQLGYLNGKLVCYVVLGFFQYGIYNLDGSLITINDIPPEYTQTSQGIRFFEHDKIYWGDETLFGIFNGVIIREWIQRSNFTAGQGQEGGMPIVGNKVNYMYNPGGNVLFPRLAVNGNKISPLFVDNAIVYWDTLLEEDISKPVIPVDPEVEIMLPALDKPIWQAPFFSHSRQYGVTPLHKHVGNAIWLRTSEKELNPGVLPLITQVDSSPVDINVDLTIAYWVSAGNIADLQAQVNIALTYPEKPVIAYLDGDGWPDHNPFSSDRAVWPSIMAYRFPGVSLADFDNKLTAIITKVESYGLPMVLTSRFDDFNGQSTVNAILECMPLYDKWIRNYNFVGHMPFSDRRGNAISSNESLWNWARAFQFSIASQRPNRYDYWRPAGMTEKQVLDNKLHQGRAAIVLEKYLRDYILNFDNGSNLEWPNLLPIVESVRAKYPSLVNVDQCVAIVNEVAKLAPKQYEFGLLVKNGGNHGTLSDGTKCSVDWCVSRTLKLGTDCLIATPSSTEGPSLSTASPNWGTQGEAFNLENWKAPI